MSVDKFMKLDDNMSLKDINDLCQYITDALKFFESQGIDWRKKVKITSTPRIDDTCGYPIIMNDDEFEQLPFPEAVEGDEKLANL